VDYGETEEICDRYEAFLEGKLKLEENGKAHEKP
jgi:hypothetical protein